MKWTLSASHIPFEACGVGAESLTCVYELETQDYAILL